MLQQLQWQTLQSRRAYAQTVMLYNLVDISAEHHLNRTSLRTRGHTQELVYRISFFPQVIRLWNQLPGSVVEADSRLSCLGQFSSKFTTVFILLTSTVHRRHPHPKLREYITGICYALYTEEEEAYLALLLTEKKQIKTTL